MSDLFGNHIVGFLMHRLISKAFVHHILIGIRHKIINALLIDIKAKLAATPRLRL